MAKNSDIKVTFIRRPRKQAVKMPEEDKVRRPRKPRKTMNA